MATSGTIGQTTINTAKILEKALRRCGLNPSIITPEIVETAKEDLFLLLTSLAQRGLNLWCIDKKLMGLATGQATYVLPIGSTDVLNLLQSFPTLVTGSEVADANTCTVNLSDPSEVCRFGVRFASQPASFTFQVSSDGLAWTTVLTVTDPTSTSLFNWFELDPPQNFAYFRVSAPGSSPSELQLATQIRDLPVSQFNRDDYFNQPDKLFQSGVITNFYFEKLVNPQITLWPRPSSDTAHLTLARYRQIQDVGRLTEELEIPIRWFEAICWHLALRLSFEIPEVTSERRKELQAMASSMVIEVEGGENDSAPVYFAPNIGVYTR